MNDDAAKRTYGTVHTNRNNRDEGFPASFGTEFASLGWRMHQPPLEM